MAVGSGGTEAVAMSLGDVLSGMGWETHLISHGEVPDGQGARTRFSGRTYVHELPAVAPVSRKQLYDVRSRNVPELSGLFAAIRPSVVQLHGFTARAANRIHIDAAKEVGSRIVIWHNVPGVTCLQKGLLYKGTQPCDGQLDVERCTECRLYAHSFQGVLGAGLAARILTSGKFGSLRHLVPNRLKGVVEARRDTLRFADAWRVASESVDRFRVGSDWVSRVLQRNGIPAEKLELIRPGVNGVFHQACGSKDDSGFWREAGALRVAYWGRIHRSKGVHTVLEALMHCKAVSLDLAVIGQWPDGDSYLDSLRRQAELDGRARFPGPKEPGALAGMVRNADVCVVPSRWHETGPLTVFEARAAGLPVVGARRGGVSELCENDPSARLFEPENPKELAGILIELAENRSVLARMQESVPEPRTMKQVAHDAAAMYERLLAKN